MSQKQTLGCTTCLGSWEQQFRLQQDVQTAENSAGNKRVLCYSWIQVTFWQAQQVLWDAGKRQVWLVALLYPKCLQLRQGMDLFNSSWSFLMAKLGTTIPCGWQEGSIIQGLKEGQFQWGTTGGTEPKSCVGAVNISHGLAVAECIRLVELCSFTQTFCPGKSVQKGHLQRRCRDQRNNGIATTCSRCRSELLSQYVEHQHLQEWGHPLMFFLCPWDAPSSAI